MFPERKAGINITKHIPGNIICIVRAFAEESTRLFPGSKIMLFGSYAKGSYGSDSDIDIAVFLPERFKPCSPVQIYRQLCRVASKYDCDIQPQVFYEDEFINPEGIVEEIVRFGIDSSELGL